MPRRSWFTIAIKPNPAQLKICRADFRCHRAFAFNFPIGAWAANDSSVDGSAGCACERVSAAGEGPRATRCLPPARKRRPQDWLANEPQCTYFTGEPTVGRAGLFPVQRSKVPAAQTPTPYHLLLRQFVAPGAFHRTKPPRRPLCVSFDEGRDIDVQTDLSKNIRPPSKLLLALEGGRALAECHGTLTALPILRTAPRGDGHSVLIFPGLTASDASTLTLREFLRARVARLLARQRRARRRYGQQPLCLAAAGADHVDLQPHRRRRCLAMQCRAGNRESREYRS